MEHVRQILLGTALAIISNAALAVTASPTPLAPVNGQTNWLFNSGSGFQWSSISGATYRIVISDRPDFANFNESLLSCTDSGCATYASSSTLATPSNLAGFWFYGTPTYYWKVRASTTSGGTSSWSPTFQFTTTSAGLRSTVQAAISYINQASPVSKTDTKATTTWATDMATGDGGRHRTALTRLKTSVDSTGYATWVSSGRTVSSTVRSGMANDLSSYGTYAGQIVNRMIALYAGSVPSTDDATLTFLGYRAQCKEFADRMVSQGGLTARSYSYGSASSYPHPGFYVFNRGSHAGIARAISFNSSGVPIIQMIESNWGTGWTNPVGQVPWLRTIAGGRTLTINGAPYVAVDPS